MCQHMLFVAVQQPLCCCRYVLLLYKRVAAVQMLISACRSIRRWERTEEPFFVEEEREKRLESLFEADAGDARPSVAELQGEAIGDEGRSASVAIRGPEVAGAADSLLEALDLAAHETQRMQVQPLVLYYSYDDTTSSCFFLMGKGTPRACCACRARQVALWQSHRPPPQQHADAVIAAPPATPVPPTPAPNPLLLGMSPSAYVLRAVRAVKPSDMEATLLMLPFHDSLTLLQHVVEWLQSARAVELSVRVACLLLRLHMGRLMAAPSARPMLVALRGGMRHALQVCNACMVVYGGVCMVLLLMVCVLHSAHACMVAVGQSVECVKTVQMECHAVVTHRSSRTRWDSTWLVCRCCSGRSQSTRA